jgi:hypothetical protein
MPKRIKQRWPADVNEVAYQLIQRATGQDKPAQQPTQSEISRVMAELGRRGGKKGGKRRLETMTPEERHQIALKAARTRWRKHKG